MASVQERVVAAGYGAMLERHGFEPVSNIRYRLTRPGIVWYAGIGKGHKDDPDTFRDYIGCQVEDLPELMHKLGEAYKREPIPGTRIPCDWSDDTVGLRVTAEERARWNNRPKTRYEKFLDVFGLFPGKQSRPPFFERHPDILYSPRSLGYIWQVPRFRLFQSFVDELIDLWQTYTWSELENRLTLEAYFKKYEPLEELSFFFYRAIITAYLAGSHRKLNDYFTYLLERGDTPRGEIERRLEERGALDPKRLKQRGWTRKETIDREQSIYLKEARQAENARDTLYPGSKIGGF